MKQAFERYLYEENKDGSGKASSYLRALDLLGQMLEAEPYGFSDCINIWSVEAIDRLAALRTFVLAEQKKGDASPWVRKGIPARPCSKSLPEGRFSFFWFVVQA